VLRVDAQLSVLEAAVKGFVKWRKAAQAAQDKSPVQNADSNGRRAAIEQTLATWGNSLLEKSFDVGVQMCVFRVWSTITDLKPGPPNPKTSLAAARLFLHDGAR